MQHNDPRLDAFLHGGSYPDTQGRVRTVGCASCAFIESPHTVRTANLSVADLIVATAELDDFVCHEPEDGQAKRCRRWHMAHRANEQDSLTNGEATAAL